MPIKDLKLGDPRISAASRKTLAQIEEACQIQQDIWGEANREDAYVIAQIIATNRVADALNDVWQLMPATQTGLSETE